MTDNDSMNLNTLCNFANGTFVTLDDCLPDTETEDAADQQLIAALAATPQPLARTEAEAKGPQQCDLPNWAQTKEAETKSVCLVAKDTQRPGSRLVEAVVDSGAEESVALPSALPDAHGGW